MINIFGRKKGRVTPARRRVLFVSHEATRTGAPKIILQLLKHFSSECDIQCESILISGGHLAAEFGKYSVVDCFNLSSEPSESLKSRVQQVVARERSNIPVLAICNSMESRYVTQELSKWGIPTISLVHELPSSYSEADYQLVYQLSRKVVFPCHSVRDETDQKISVPQGKTMVLSQGLLDPDFTKNWNPQQARKQIREELRLPPESQIVLGCGTLDLRKGIDHFANIARKVIASSSENLSIHFVWVGSGARWEHSTFHYIQIDLEKSGAAARVHFIGEREDVAPYFLGSDLFLLTSRVDPFPCVIHEAMISQLPVLAFQNSGGATEAIGQGAGFPIPYADYDQAVRMIQILLEQPALCDSVRERAFERVQTRYRFDQYADHLIELGESILGQRLRTVPQRTSLPFSNARRAS